MLYASLATRRTFVRRRVTADNANALSALGLFILRIFSYPQKEAVKTAFIRNHNTRKTRFYFTAQAHIHKKAVKFKR